MTTRPLYVFLAALACALLLAAAPALAADRFTDNKDGTVTDHERGLLWSKTDNQGDVSWQDAQRWARYTFPTTLPAASGDWRLPTVDELASLVRDSAYYQGYDTHCGLTVNIHKLFDLSCAFVWAAETQGVTARLYNFQLDHASMDRKAKTRGYRALAVRNLHEAGD